MKELAVSASQTCDAMNASTTGLYTSVSSDFRQKTVQQMIARRITTLKNVECRTCGAEHELHSGARSVLRNVVDDLLIDRAAGLVGRSDRLTSRYHAGIPRSLTRTTHTLGTAHNAPQQAV